MGFEFKSSSLGCPLGDVFLDCPEELLVALGAHAHVTVQLFE